MRCAEWLLDNLYSGGLGGGSTPLTAETFAAVTETGSVQLLRTQAPLAVLIDAGATCQAQADAKPKSQIHTSLRAHARRAVLLLLAR